MMVLLIDLTLSCSSDPGYPDGLSCMIASSGALQMENQRESVLETVTRSLTMLVINNRTNQDYIRCTNKLGLYLR